MPTAVRAFATASCQPAAPRRHLRARRWLCLALLGLAQTALAAPQWFEPAGDGWRARPVVQQALTLLEQAADDGLNPADYPTATLDQALVAAHQPLPEARAQALDAQLTALVQRYLDDLHTGRIDPRALHRQLEIEPPTPLPPTLLSDALAQGRLDDAVRAATPPGAPYARLREALAQYRQIDTRHGSAWARPLANPPSLPLLTERLRALGDWPDDRPAPKAINADVRAAVRAFQARHGLPADGQLNAGTLRTLNVSPAQRVRQIALNMERLRWMAPPAAPRLIDVNLPEFMLRALSREGEHYREDLAMRVIVGRALDTSTPLMSEQMESIEFSPYWNIPPSIARQETVPRLRRDPSYLSRANLELVGPGGQVLRSASAAQLDAVLAGKMRIRQRPGPNNALGDIKFIMPNNSNIYLHHTPSVGLFQRSRRDFSHGCIRVEAPVALAQFVLQDDPAWTEQRIRRAMSAGKSTFTRLQEPLPVRLSYNTATAHEGAAGVQASFFDDIYGFDRALAAELVKNSEQRKRRGLVPVAPVAPTAP